MSEFRQNFATKEWVIIAPERALRPIVHTQEHTEAQHPGSWSASCPFCPGNENETGDELYRSGSGDTWSMRAVRNKYSALLADAPVERMRQGRFLKAGSRGHAEVIIESPLHNGLLSTFDARRMEELLRVYHWRMTEVNIMPDIALVMLFRNSGALAGTSLPHPHSQLIASPIIPPNIRNPIQKAVMHYDSWGSCVFCDMITEELSQRDRIIAENEHAVAFCPFASRTPYELRIYPRKHNASFTWTGETELLGVATVLRQSLQALRSVLHEPSYNMMLRSSPTGDEDVRYLHWYFAIVPRISTPAGFEMGSGIYINPVAPETCARELREALHEQ